jgi:hypothetical protein
MTRSIVFIPIGIILIVVLVALMPTIQAGISHIDAEPVEFQNGVAVATGGNGVIDIYGSHAWDTHGEAEAMAALECLENKGPSLTYREPNKGPVHFLCLGEDGKWYDVIVEMLKKGKMELKSAFSPKDGTSSAIRVWLENKGATPWKAGPSTIELRWNIPKPW